MFKGRNKWGTLILSAGWILLLTGCSTPTFSTVNASNTEVPLQVVEAKTQSTLGDVTVTGIFDTEDKSVVTSQVPGKVVKVQTEEGKKVHKGDTLIVLDESEFQTSLSKANLGVQKAQADIEQAKLAYDVAQKNVERVDELYKAGAISLKDLEQVTLLRDNAKLGYETALNVGLPMANQNVATAQQALAKTKIVAPIDGTVASLTINPGDNVNPGVPLVTLVSEEKLILSGNVSESVINSLQIGQEATINVDSVKGIALKGKVSFISPVSIPTGQFFPVNIALDNPTTYLKPGMTGNAIIHVEDSTSIAVPNTAVIRRDGRNFVFITKDGKVEKTPVQIGLQGEKLTVIQQGIVPGEWVVVEGNKNVYEGMPVEKVDKVQ